MRTISCLNPIDSEKPTRTMKTTSSLKRGLLALLLLSRGIAPTWARVLEPGPEACGRRSTREPARTRKPVDSVSLYDKGYSSNSNRLTADMFSLLQSPQGGSSQTLQGTADFLTQEKMNNLARGLHDPRCPGHSDLRSTSTRTYPPMY
jgi:hypothetical protein